MSYNKEPELQTIDVNSKKTPRGVATGENRSRYSEQEYEYESSAVRNKRSSDSSSKNSKKKNKKKKKLRTSTKWIIGLCIFLALVLILLSVLYFYLQDKINRRDYQPTEPAYSQLYTLPTNYEYETKNEDESDYDKVDIDDVMRDWYDNDPQTFYYSDGIVSADYVTNILLIGTDLRGDDDSWPGLADTNILVSINKKTKKIYLTSFMRDMYVYIPEYEGCDKLNSAHGRGGAKLLMDTISGNFKVKIDDYARVNFYSLIDIIDAAGGIDMYVSEDEAYVLNYTYIYWMCKEAVPEITNPQDYYLTEWDKTVHLTGMQAVAYARIRYVGNSDYQRTQRQRDVVEAIADNCKHMNPAQLDAFANEVIPMVATSLDSDTIWELISAAPEILTSYEIVSQRVPFDDTSTPASIQMDGWVNDVLVPDYKANSELLIKSIYGE